MSACLAIDVDHFPGSCYAVCLAIDNVDLVVFLFRAMT